MTILLIIVGVLLFNLIVIAHECGHFFPARWFGIKVIEFSLGMGPRILKIIKKGTIYSLKAFPIGGSCMMEGEDEESDSPDSFEKRSAWKRMIVIAGGAIMNMVLGFLLILFILAQKPKFLSTTIAKFDVDAMSSSYGLQVNDTITRIDGFKIYTYQDLGFSLSVDKKETFDIDVIRNGEKIHLENVRFSMITDNKGNPATNIDFYVSPINKTFGTLVRQTFFETVSTVKMVWSGLIGIITGRFAINNIVGPIGMTSIVSEVATEGLKVSPMAAINNVVHFMAVITVNLGVVNLLPLPALDGGRLLLLLFELITRKKLKSKHEGWINAIGFFLLIGLMILIAFGDIARLFGWLK